MLPIFCGIRIQPGFLLSPKLLPLLTLHVPSLLPLFLFVFFYLYFIFLLLLAHSVDIVAAVAVVVWLPFFVGVRKVTGIFQDYTCSLVVYVIHLF